MSDNINVSDMNNPGKPRRFVKKKVVKSAAAA
jgi:hypothetical protein